MLMRKIKKHVLVAFLVFVLLLLELTEVDVCLVTASEKSSTNIDVSNSSPSFLPVASDNGMGQALHDAFQFAKPEIKRRMDAHMKELNVSAPTVSIISIVQNQTFSGNVSLCFTVSQKAVIYQYCINGQENITIPGNTTLTDLPVGEQSIIVYALIAGYIGASETVNFTIAEQKTTETNVETSSTINFAPVGGLFVAFAVLGLIVYRKYTRANSTMKPMRGN